jgi:stage II sporulation protein D (peptidoglycan lytic transglycosylase)
MTTNHIATEAQRSRRKTTRWFFLCVLCASVATLSSSSPRAAQQDPSRVEVRIGVLRPGGGYTVQTIALETYIARVLAGEAARDSRPAALEALAITIRTFVLANPGRHNADGFDLCDQTHCQVMRTPTPAHERAAAATAGQALLRGGLPVPVFYSASCGGRTEIPSAVWPGHEDPPYMPSQPDDACMGAPVWTAELESADLVRALRAAGFRGELRDFRILTRDVSGRVARLRLAGMMPEDISGQDLRAVVGRTLGWQHIKSAAFELERAGDRYRFEGRGYGHGVGMCVIGSVNMAVAGRTATEILNKYFPGLDIGVPGAAAAPPVVAARGAAPPVARATASGAPPVAAAVNLALPDDDEGERDAIAQLTERTRGDIARALGVPAPPRVTVRFHPTTASYERATSQPWFTSGAVVGGELHLLPLAVLRERGVLERTIRHEIVHLIADPVLRERRAWVREGAAIYFAGRRPIPGEAEPSPFRPQSRLSCPGDAELLQPVSAGALSNAFARALACFSRQVDGGKSWRDVK